MVCPECNGRGKAIYYVETDRDENTVTVKKRECICRTCNGSGEMPQTNADRIRAMSDEELAKIMAGTPICKERYMDCLKDGKDCEFCLLEWLKQPADE